jgi:hypothetical protein
MIYRCENGAATSCWNIFCVGYSTYFGHGPFWKLEPCVNNYDEILKKPKPNKKILIQRHLNFEVRFHVENKIVTHKSVYFNKDQIHPSITKCCKGRCVLLLCRIAEANGTVPEKIYDPSMEGNDPLIRKLVKILSLGGVSFHDPDGCEEDLNLNWKRLRNMAQPVVDEQLAKLAMEGKWKNSPVQIDLGWLLLDNNAIRFDEESYDEMEKDGPKDLLQCEVAWEHKIESELKKRGITKVENSLVKYKKKKWSTVFGSNRENNGMVVKGVDGENLPPVVKKEKVTKESLEEWVAGKEPEKLPVDVPVVEAEKEYKHCCEQPCVWIAKKEDMIFYDKSEHGLLPKEDLPPNNIRRKKLYRQMTLHLQASGWRGAEGSPTTTLLLGYTIDYREPLPSTNCPSKAKYLSATWKVMVSRHITFYRIEIITSSRKCSKLVS